MTFEIGIIKALQSGRNDFFDVFFGGFAYLATVWSVLALALLCFFFVNKKIGFAFLITEGFAYISTYALKHIIKRARPFVANPDILNLGNESGYSLPSGHLTCAIIITIFLFYIAFRYFKTKGRTTVGIFASLFTLLMIVDRMYLGAHYLTDTLAGIVIGGVWCAIAFVALPPVGKVFDSCWAKIVAKHKQKKETKEAQKAEQSEK